MRRLLLLLLVGVLAFAAGACGSDEDDDPANGKGFESAVAYAIADKLGLPKDKVKWTVVPFNSSYAPGPKKFDFDIIQISITPKRAERVDFSKPYYTAPQAVVSLKSSPT